MDGRDMMGQAKMTTLDQLKAISEACETDVEFLRHVEVRRAYWKCLGKFPTCEDLYPIPGSMADAAEVLRVRVAEQADHNRRICALRAVRGLRAETWERFAVYDSARTRFLVFAAALLGEEVGG
jgi:hypothetical protein